MGAGDVVVSLPSQNSAKIVKWKVEEGTIVYEGRVLLLYDVNSSGGNVESKKLKATEVGTVRKLLAKEGELVDGGAPLLELELGCSHPTVVNDLCAECGADLRRENLINAQASVPMVHCVPDLKVSEEEAQILGKADVERLLNDRKLVLLVDLDQTLIHTTNDNIPNNLKDVYHFQLYGPRSPWYHTRLRPGTQQFLAKISKLYELHICTFGARNYAHMIAHFLDPDGKFFSHRILSRDECFNPNSKMANLKALFPCGDEMVCIIDDREDVWNFAPNLIHVKPYHFFQHTGDINAPPGLAKKENDEKEGFDFSQFAQGTSIRPKEPDLKSKENTPKRRKDDSSESELEEGELRSRGENDLDFKNKIEIREKNADELMTAEDVGAGGDSQKKEKPVINSDEDKENHADEPTTAGDVGVFGDSQKKENPVLNSEGDKENNPDEPMTAEDVGVSGDSQKKEKPVINSDKKDNADEPMTAEVVGVSGDCQKKEKPVINSNKDKENNADEPMSAEDVGVSDDKKKNKDPVINSDEDKENNADEPMTAEDVGVSGDNQKNKDPVINSDEDKENTAEEKVKDIAKDKVKEETESNHLKIESAENEAKNGEIKLVDKTKLVEGEFEIEESDDYLMYLEEILAKIHSFFYEVHDTKRDIERDMKKVIPAVKSEVLAGTKLVFSGLVPTNQSLEQSRAYNIAKSLGAEVVSELTKDCTHLVAVRTGTAKVNSARRMREIKLVTPDWLWTCAERWEHVEEALYPVGCERAGSRHPPPHCASPPHHGTPAPRLRSPSGRFMDTINPLMTFSSEDIADMDAEVEDMCNESDSDAEDKAEKKQNETKKRCRSPLGFGEDSNSSSSDSLAGDHVKGWGRKRPREEDNVDSDDNESLGDKFRRGAEMPSDVELNEDSIGSDDAPDEISDGDWNMMGAALEREFLEGD